MIYRAYGDGMGWDTKRANGQRDMGYTRRRYLVVVAYWNKAWVKVGSGRAGRLSGVAQLRDLCSFCA